MSTVIFNSDNSVQGTITSITSTVIQHHEGLIYMHIIQNWVVYQLIQHYQSVIQMQHHQQYLII